MATKKPNINDYKNRLTSPVGIKVTTNKKSKKNTTKKGKK